MANAEPFVFVTRPAIRPLGVFCRGGRGLLGTVLCVARRRPSHHWRAGPAGRAHSRPWAGGIRPPAAKPYKGWRTMKWPRWITMVVGALAAGGLTLSLRVPCGPSSPSAPAGEGGGERPPAVAGAFYPADPEALRTEVNRCLQAGRAGPQVEGELVALIVPHAGYVYSGAVAGHAYRLLEGKRYGTVVLVGPSHRVPLSGLALSGATRWTTPLGSVPLDAAGREALLKVPSARVSDEAHAAEHSLEVQLPFLQATLGEFRLLPVVIGAASDDVCSALAKAIADYAAQRSVLLIASTDMSHYPAYEDAVRVDGEVVRAIGAGDPGQVERAIRAQMARGVPNLQTCLCGEAPVKVVLMAARQLGAGDIRLLKYANSGDVPGGDRTRVVGYCAFALCRRRQPQGKEHGNSSKLTPDQQERLLAIARNAIVSYVSERRIPEVTESDPALLRPAAAFVTLRERGQLRGCIGTLVAETPLAQTVRDRAIAAATEDPRFAPVSRGELESLEIEVSVLSPLRRVSSAEEIELGRHGVLVQSAGRAGVFLPQVAHETGWSREEFLSHLCRDKAGLPADAWRRGADLYVFTVESFTSPALGGRSHGGA